ncbi:MAG: hypothetical protein PHH04_00760 [Thomasclavelia sp.]|nr:hypothetical protein [Thomasclavelia sp.]
MLIQYLCFGIACLSLIGIILVMIVNKHLNKKKAKQKEELY